MLRSKFHLEKCNKAPIKHNPDFVLDNFVEAEMKSVLRPLYLAQYLSLAPKYSIRYDLITSNSHKFNVFVCLCAVGISTTWWFSSVLDYLIKAEGMYAATVFAYSVTLLCAIILNSFITTSHSNMNANLIVLIQRIQKRFIFVKFDTRDIAKGNWLFVIIISTYNVAHFAARFLDTNIKVISTIVTHLIYLSIDFNSIVAIRMIHLLGKLIETWISELKCSCCANCFDIEAKDYLRKIIISYDELMEAIKICNKIFRVPIFFTVLSSFFHAFVIVQGAISVSLLMLRHRQYLQMPVWKKSLYAAQLIWIKNLTLVAILCMESENIHLKVKNAQVACIVLCARERTSELSQLMRRQEQWAGPERGEGWLRAAGLFSVDAALPPRFLAVLGTYIVAILQLHFL
nr:gustatory receptor 43 [Papilio machaon]